MTLFDFVRSTADRWRGGEDVSDTFVDQLDFLREHIEELYTRYEPEAPVGAEEIRELMLEALDRFSRALDNLELYADGGADELLDEAVELAQEGDDVLESVHYAIGQSQQMATITDD